MSDDNNNVLDLTEMLARRKLEAALKASQLEDNEKRAEQAAVLINIVGLGLDELGILDDTAIEILYELAEAVSETLGVEVNLDTGCGDPECKGCSLDNDAE